jgi:PAS domain S-box-containing protein
MENESNLENLLIGDKHTFLRTVFDGIQDGISVLDTDLRIIKTNKWIKQKHLNNLPLDGKKCYEAYQHRSSPCPRCPSLRTLSTGKVHFEEVAVSFADDSNGWIRITSFPLKNNHGVIVGVIEHVREITDQKKIEIEFKKNTELLTSVLESTNNGILVVNQNGAIIAKNIRFEELWQIPEEISASDDEDKMLEHIVNQLSSPNEFLEKVKHLYQHPSTTSFDTLHFKDGRVFERYSQPLRIKNEIMGRVWSFRDVTKRTQANKKSQDSELMLTNVLNTIPSRVFWKNKDGKYLGCNQRVVEDAGKNHHSEIIGKTDFDMPWHEQAEQYQKDDQIVMQTGKPKINYEEPQRTPNGSTIWLRTSKIPLRDAHGDIYGMLGTYEDITDWKKAQFEIQEKNRELQQRKEELTTANSQLEAMNHELKEAHSKLRDLNKHLERKVEEKTEELTCQNEELTSLNQELTASNEELTSTQQELHAHVETVDELVKQKDEFIHMLGHDLKNPMTSIFTLLPVVEHKVDDPKIKDMVQRVVKSTKRMREIIDETLKIARLNDVGRTLNLRQINLSDVVKHSIDHNDSLLTKYHVTVQNNIDDHIQVNVDLFQFEELIANLLTNAVKYTDEGKNAIVTVDANINNEGVQVMFSDNGIGMTKGQMDRVFDKFYTAGTPREGLTSSGLGLSICKQIIEKHQGRIWVESKGPGKGSTFYFTLPKNGEEPLKIT